MNAGTHDVEIEAGDVVLAGTLGAPPGALGVVAFAHGAGSSRFSPRNQMVATELRKRGLATLLMDLLTAEEERSERATAHLRFDIEMLAGRLTDAVTWLDKEAETAGLPVGLFGASTGAAAALIAAAALPDRVGAVVSRGGRPDLAGRAIPLVRAPTLLIVGGADTVVLDLHRDVLDRFTTEVRLEVIRDASHLFEEPGALEEVAGLAAEWFQGHLAG